MRLCLVLPLAFDTSMFFHAIGAVENGGVSGSPWTLDGIPLDVISIAYTSTTRLPSKLLLSKLGVLVILSEDCRSPLIDFLELNGATISRQPNPWLIASTDGPVRLRLTHLKCHSFGLVRERDTLRVLLRVLLARADNVALRPQPEVFPPLAYCLIIDYLRGYRDQRQAQEQSLLVLKMDGLSKIIIERLRSWLETRDDIPVELIPRIKMIMRPFWPESRWRLERVTNTLFHLQLERIETEVDRLVVSLLERVLLELTSSFTPYHPPANDDGDEIEGNDRRVWVIWSRESACVVIRLRTGIGLGNSSPQTPSMPQ
ncbi:hypothetical protein GMRT_16342 [Giardia muris]|uniref:Uncharacterized protein n=1 Tax=Giardia muris TaxID=5742 RepID=A0A4Z1TAX7_GIAMU|nr:hypothetical protein GMRT_16342 [Giardia muris]|eukprot:TNJ29689.1 hypothetical protein GMRT_16342 [Giardia muris]